MGKLLRRSLQDVDAAAAAAAIFGGATIPDGLFEERLLALLAADVEVQRSRPEYMELAPALPLMRASLEAMLQAVSFASGSRRRCAARPADGTPGFAFSAQALHVFLAKATMEESRPDPVARSVISGLLSHHIRAGGGDAAWMLLSLEEVGFPAAALSQPAVLSCCEHVAPLIAGNYCV